MRESCAEQRPGARSRNSEATVPACHLSLRILGLPPPAHEQPQLNSILGQNLDQHLETGLLNPVLGEYLEDLENASIQHELKCQRYARQVRAPTAALRCRGPAQSRSRSAVSQPPGEKVLPELGRVLRLVPPPRSQPASGSVGRCVLSAKAIATAIRSWRRDERRRCSLQRRALPVPPPPSSRAAIDMTSRKGSVIGRLAQKGTKLLQKSSRSCPLSMNWSEATLAQRLLELGAACGALKKCGKKKKCVDSKMPPCVHSKHLRVCGHHAYMCFQHVRVVRVHTGDVLDPPTRGRGSSSVLLTKKSSRGVLTWPQRSTKETNGSYPFSV